MWGKLSLLMSLELNELEGPFRPGSLRNSLVWGGGCSSQPLGFNSSVLVRDLHQDGSGRGRSFKHGCIFNELPLFPVKERAPFHSPDSARPGIISRIAPVPARVILALPGGDPAVPGCPMPGFPVPALLRGEHWHAEGCLG